MTDRSARRDIAAFCWQFCVAAATAWISGCTSAGSEPIDLILANGRVITGTGEVLSRASILVDSGMIVEVSHDAPSNRAARRTIDLAGRTVLPGLIDTHVHLLIGDGNPGGQRMPRSDEALAAYQTNTLPVQLHKYLARGITTVLSTGDYFPAILTVREQTARDPHLGPRVFSVGPVVCTKGGHPVATICGGDPWCAAHLAREVTTLADVERVLSELAAARVDFVKVVHDGGLRSSLPSNLLSAVIRGAHARGLRAIVHAGSIREATEAITAGADHLVHPPATDTATTTDFARLLKAQGRIVTSTLSISSVSDEWERSAGRPPRYLPNVTANLRHLARNGATLTFGTDVPMLDVSQAVDLELRLLRAAELTPTEIIQMLTRNAAAFVGILNEVGTVERGKRADLLVVGGDPLQDLGALRDVQLVVRNGEVVFTTGRPD